MCKKEIAPPKAWQGTVEYTYETRQSGAPRDTIDRGTVTAAVTLRRIPDRFQGWGWGAAQASGTITWKASGQDRLYCTWESTGSRAVGKYDVLFSIHGPDNRPPFRADFSGQDDLEVKATRTCTYPPPNATTETSEVDQAIGHPFFVIGRITEGVPVDDGLTTIQGGRQGARSDSYSSEKWTISVELHRGSLTPRRAAPMSRGFQVSAAVEACDPRRMPSYVVESYAADSGAVVDDAQERARRTEELGDGVRYVRTTFLPGDQTILHFFEAPSAEELDRAGKLAALPFERIVEAVEGSAPGDEAE